MKKTSKRFCKTKPSELEKLKAQNSHDRCEGLFAAIGEGLCGGVRQKVEVEVVVVWRCWTVVLHVGWSGVSGPGQSFDDGVVRVDYPAAALLVEDGAVVIVEEVHGMFLPSGGVFCGGTPSKECDDEGVGVLVELPGVVDDASKFALIMGLIVGDADTLGKKARVVGKVKCAG